MSSEMQPPLPPGRIPRPGQGCPPARYGDAQTTSAFVKEGDAVQFCALWSSEDAPVPANYMYKGTIVRDHGDGTYDIMGEKEDEPVRNVSYKKMCKMDGTPVRRRIAGDDVNPPLRKRRKAGGGTAGHRWRHDGIWSMFLEPQDPDGPYVSMDRRIKYRVSIALLMHGKWVDKEEPVVLSLHDIMSAPDEEREMHLKAIVDFTNLAFHADASAEEFQEWMGGEDPFGVVKPEVQAERDAQYSKHAQFFEQAAGGSGGHALR
jgi:hypothetical protein